MLLLIVTSSAIIMAAWNAHWLHYENNYYLMYNVIPFMIDYKNWRARHINSILPSRLPLPVLVTTTLRLHFTRTLGNRTLLLRSKKCINASKNALSPHRYIETIVAMFLTVQSNEDSFI